jgi:hypothetical protein
VGILHAIHVDLQHLTWCHVYGLVGNTQVMLVYTKCQALSLRVALSMKQSVMVS